MDEQITLDLRLTEQQTEIFDYEGPARFHTIKKGRRFGFTYGAAIKSIEWCLQDEGPILWGDTVHGNLTRYVERYFLPKLKGIPHRYRDDKKLLTIGEQNIDLRSAEHPENWEGFGYRRIILNEAGIILQDPYLYYNAVLPMMMDYPDAQLFAGGVPKGKLLKDGREHPFFTLDKLGMSDSPLHRSLSFSSYDNPFLSRDDIALMEKEIAAMSPEEVRQEIYGEFVDAVSGQRFAHKFDQIKHVKSCHQMKQLPTFVSVDFNVDPFCAIFASIWEDQHGPHCWVWAEESIHNATVAEMAQRIKARIVHPLLLEMTGDHGGVARRLGAKSSTTLFGDMSNILNLHDRQLTLPANPPHLTSREDVNYALVHHPDLRIDPSCTGLIRDLLTVEVMPDGKIKKSDRTKVAQQSDLLDAFRYLVNTYLRDWLKHHRRAMQ